MDAAVEPVLRLAHAAEPAPRIVEIALADIFDGERLRDIDPAWAAALAANFEAGGKPPPIEVRVPAADEGIAQPYALVVGGHRVAAFRLLGRSKIRAEVRDLTRLQARLVECDENLFRHELNPLDKGVFLRERKRVYEELHPETRHGAAPKSKKAQEEVKWQGLPLNSRRFTAEAAERTGMSERAVRAAIALVEALTPETITLLRGTETARNAAELKRLAEERAEHQPLIAKALRAGATSVAAARIQAGVAPANDDDPQEDLFRRICSTWDRLDAKGRKRFLAHAGLTQAAPSSQALRRTGVRT